VTYHRARVTDDVVSSTHVGVGVGIDVGVDIVERGAHRLGAFARVETQVGADIVVPLLGLGVSYRY
jgi:hypothetical protein